jgi:hypothetical protein
VTDVDSVAGAAGADAADVIDDGTAITQDGRDQRAPAWVVWVLIVLATILAVGATLNTWVQRQLLDTDQWVEVSDDMLADDAVRGALSTYLVAELFRTVDVQGELESALPGPTSALAGPIAATLQGNAVGLVDQLLGSEAFRSLWTDVNRTAHTAFVRVIEDDTPESISTANGAFVVDARALLVGVAERLGLPDAIGERIPETAGQIVVFESEQLDTVQRAARLIDALSVYLFVLVVLLYGLAVYLSGDRRRTLRNVGWALVLSSVVLLVVHHFSIDVAVDQLARAENGRAAVDAIASIATRLLNELSWAGVSLGAVIVAYAVLTGPTRAAVAVRRVSAPVMSRPFGAWMVALGFLALYLLFVPGFSLRRWLPALIFVALFIAGVELLRRQIAREHASVVTADS